MGKFTPLGGKRRLKKGNGMVTTTTYRQGEFREICLWKGVDRDLQQIVIRKCKKIGKMPGIVFIMTFREGFK